MIMVKSITVTINMIASPAAISETARGLDKVQQLARVLSEYPHLAYAGAHLSLVRRYRDAVDF